MGVSLFILLYGEKRSGSTPMADFNLFSLLTSINVLFPADLYYSTDDVITTGLNSIIALGFELTSSFSSSNI